VRRRIPMPHRSINVTFVNPELADAIRSHNPMEVNRGDTVDWTFTGLAGQPQGLEIRLLGFLPNDRTIPISGPGVPEVNPFTSLPSDPTAGPFTVRPDTEEGIYFYGIFRGDQEIKWAAPVFTAGSFHAFFGCLVVPHPPDTSTG
jgi:hypothetical protein